MFTIASNDRSPEWNNSNDNSSFTSFTLDLEDYDSVNSTQLVLDNTTKCRLPPRRPRSFPRSATGATVTMLSFYTCPAILAVGVLSNLLAYLVFTRTKLRKVPSVPYLAAMAVADSGALITEFIMVPLLQHGVFLITKAGVCQYVSYLNYVFIFLCMWYPVALCVEKFITVYYPLRKAVLCTPFRAKVVVIGMAVLSGVCYYYVIYMFGPQKHKFFFGEICGAWEEFHADYNILMKMDSIFVNVLPFIVLISLMILICGRGWEYYRISSAAEVTNRSGPSRATSSDSPVRVTNVVFPVVIIMLLLKLPTCIMRFAGLISQGTPPLQITLDLQPVFLYVGRLDWAVKLYVYLIFSPSFRRSFRSFFSSTFSRIKARCSQQTVEDEADVISPCINLAERHETGREARTCLITSADV